MFRYVIFFYKNYDLHEEKSIIDRNISQEKIH